MVILVAPDKFKGTLTAPRAAEAIAVGLRRAHPDARIELQPLADGGEGTVDALRSGLGGDLVPAVITGPLGAPVEAVFGRLDDGRVAIEVASVTGLARLARYEYAPLEATSRGVGELVATVMDDYPGAPILIGIGGTASTDGGTGAATALGYRFLGARGQELPPGGGALVRLARIDNGTARRAAGVTGICDVANPLLGNRGCARVYGPQKGATPGEVELLEEAMGVLADRISADLGLDIADVPGAGAGGGLGAGLVAFMGAKLLPGAAVVTAAVGLPERIGRADLVVTGEGSIDRQSLEGKVPATVARMATEARVPCIAVAGRIELSEAEMRAAGFSAWASSVDVAGTERALSDPAATVSEATRAALAALDHR